MDQIEPMCHLRPNRSSTFCSYSILELDTNLSPRHILPMRTTPTTPATNTTRVPRQTMRPRNVVGVRGWRCHRRTRRLRQSRFEATSRKTQSEKVRTSKKPKAPIFLSETGRRYYSPELGRWVSRDPIGEDGGLNLYQYVYNTPLKYYDYLGGEPQSTDASDNDNTLPGLECSIQHCLDKCNTRNRRIRGSCRLACREAKRMFEEWYDRHSNLDWTKNLPKCPCDIGCKESGDTVGEPGWGNLTDNLHGYHVGASLCMRSNPADGHANQCCYDEDGALITHGAGAGSSDYVPGTWRTFPGHRREDMLPADWAKKLDGGGWGCWSEAYLRARPQVGSEDCPENP